ncbi:MAG: box helicase domain protein [Rhodospirillales bacterium]|nr:box helicase domain protein [Rhodospirillales bacterium]
MTISLFSELALRPELQQALADQGYSTPTPIQAQAIPHLLEGRDLLGIAQTGTGKTAAFTLPILQKLADAGIRPRPGQVKALILTPTRELAIQIDDSVKNYGAHLKLKHAVIFGGVGQGRQVDALQRGLDILVATPGRLLDLMNQRHVRFDDLSVFVLDEADRMLDMGFINDVRKIVATLPKSRQTLLFSATMPREIADLAAKLLNNPTRVEVTPQATTVERIGQHVIHVPMAQKRHVMVDLLADPSMTRVIAFSRTKHGANKVTDHLNAAGITSAAIHGNKSQGARQAALESFRAGKVRVLVATDIAARGIDIDGISHVINVDLPNVSESYVHRIGRTARAGKDGIAISLCDTEERAFLRDIEKLIGQRVPVMELPTATPRIATPAPQRPAQPQRRPQHKRPEGHRPEGHRQDGRQGAGPGQNRAAQGANRNAPQGDRNRPARVNGPRG